MYSTQYLFKTTLCFQELGCKLVALQGELALVMTKVAGLEDKLASTCTGEVRTEERVTSNWQERGHVI